MLRSAGAAVSRPSRTLVPWPGAPWARRGTPGVLRAGVQLDFQRLTAHLGVGDPAEGGGRDVPTDLHDRVRVEDVDPAQVATGQAALGSDCTHDAGRADTMGMTDGDAVPRACRGGVPLART